MDAFEKFLALTLPAVTTFAAVALLIAYAYRYFLPHFQGASEPAARRVRGLHGAKLLGWIALWVALSRLSLYLIALVGCAVTGQAEVYLANPGAYWVRSRWRFRSASRLHFCCFV